MSVLKYTTVFTLYFKNRSDESRQFELDCVKMLAIFNSFHEAHQNSILCVHYTLIRVCMLEKYEWIHYTNKDKYNSCMAELPLIDTCKIMHNFAKYLN